MIGNQNQTQEMAKEIARILFEDCLLNIGGSCADCEWNGKETKEYDCQSLLVAKKLLEKYQPKIPEGAVVLTKEEWAEHNEMFAKAMYQKEINTRKETAEKFAENVLALFSPDMKIAVLTRYAVLRICKEITEGKVNE